MTSQWTPQTVSRALGAAQLIEMACASSDPLRRAQILAEAQPQLAWALASAVAECAEAKLTWADIGDAVGMPRETVFRQFKAGGPIVTARATQSEKSQYSKTDATADEAIYAFQTDDGIWHGDHDVLDSGEYSTAVLHFRPAASVNSPFADRILRVRVGSLKGPLKDDVSFHAAQVRFADQSERRVRVTNAVINLLFEDGQTPLRRALDALVHAAVGNPGVDPAFQAIVDNAAIAMGKATPAAEGIFGEVLPTTSEFIAAVEAIIEAAPTATPLDIHAAVALRKLENVINGYKAWARVARA